jgi:hypothetical protein
MKKILLVSGCSFTTRNYQSHHHPEIDFTSYDKWPEMLAEKLNMQCVNLAKSGAGNEFISNTIIDYIETTDKSKIGLVIPAWSQCRRRDYQTYSTRSKSTRWRFEMYDLFGDTRYWIRKSLKTYYFFQIYCDYYKIPYKQVQMIELFKDNIKIDFNEEKKEMDDFTVDEMYYKKLKNFIGETSGILSLEDVLTSNRKDKEKIKEFSISSEDSHPSKNGHRLLAEYIYENI